ncbi:MAG: hypothetical protein V4864_05005 [Pseudomonadota bacterium]
MSAMKKIAGLIAGASAVAVFGVAIAQGVPPNPFVSNPALGAGQQSTHLTSMGETGVPGFVDQVQAAAITPVPQVAVVQPAPEPMVQAQAPAPVEQQTMGAAPAEPAPAPMKVAKADRG